MFRAFIGAIIGAKGAVKKRIEGETRTEITIPKHGSSHSDDIRILATKRDAVCAARRRIDLIVTNCRKKQRPTHFTCVRIDESSIKENYIKFKVKYNCSTGKERPMETERERERHRIKKNVRSQVLAVDWLHNRRTRTTMMLCYTF